MERYLVRNRRQYIKSKSSITYPSVAKGEDGKNVNVNGDHRKGSNSRSLPLVGAYCSQICLLNATPVLDARGGQVICFLQVGLVQEHGDVGFSHDLTVDLDHDVVGDDARVDPLVGVLDGAEEGAVFEPVVCR